jgi:hypothetical protein
MISKPNSPMIPVAHRLFELVQAFAAAMIQGLEEVNELIHGNNNAENTGLDTIHALIFRVRDLCRYTLQDLDDAFKKEEADFLTIDDEAAALRTSQEEENTSKDAAAKEAASASKVAQEEASTLKAAKAQAATLKAAEEQAGTLKVAEERAATLKAAEEQAASLKATSTLEAAKEEAATLKRAQEEAATLKAATTLKAAEEEAATLKLAQEHEATLKLAQVEAATSKSLEQQETVRNAVKKRIATSKTLEEEQTTLNAAEERAATSKAPEEQDTTWNAAEDRAATSNVGDDWGASHNHAHDPANMHLDADFDPLQRQSEELQQVHPPPRFSSRVSSHRSNDIEVHEILDQRRSNNPPGMFEYLVHWQGFDLPEEHTWEPENGLRGCAVLIQQFHDSMLDHDEFDVDHTPSDEHDDVHDDLFDFLAHLQSLDDEEVEPDGHEPVVDNEPVADDATPLNFRGYLEEARADKASALVPAHHVSLAGSVVHVTSLVNAEHTTTVAVDSAELAIHLDALPFIIGKAVNIRIIIRQDQGQPLQHAKLKIKYKRGMVYVHNFSSLKICDVTMFREADMSIWLMDMNSKSWAPQGMRGLDVARFRQALSRAKTAICGTSLIRDLKSKLKRISLDPNMLASKSMANLDLSPAEFSCFIGEVLDQLGEEYCAGKFVYIMAPGIKDKCSFIFDHARPEETMSAYKALMKLMLASLRMESANVQRHVLARRWDCRIEHTLEDDNSRMGLFLKGAVFESWMDDMKFPTEFRRFFRLLICHGDSPNVQVPYECRILHDSVPRCYHDTVCFNASNMPRCAWR